MKSLSSLRKLVFLILINHCVNGFTPSWAFTSRFVPLDNWTYSAIEKLATTGFMDPTPLSTKPLTRLQVAKMVAQAIERIQKDKIKFSAFDDTKGLEQLLDGLMEEYREELVILGVSVAMVDSPTPKKRFTLRFEEVEFQSRTSSLEKNRVFLIENSEGWDIHHGLNIRGDMTVSGQWLDWWSIVLTPTFRFSQEDTNLLIEQLYAETEWKNLRFSAGRQSFWWGPGYHGSLILSNNSFPLDALRISSIDAYRFPWFFKKLGKWQTDFFLARLGAEQTIKRPKFSGLRQEWTPRRWLNIGFSHVVIFGGEGARGFDGVQLLRSYLESETGNIDEPENHIAGIDWRLTLPRVDRWIKISRGVELYGEFGFDDVSLDLNLLTLNTAHSDLMGIYLPDLFRINDLDLRVEYAVIDAGMYEHFFYLTGYRHKGEFIGHHLGPDSKDFFIRLIKKLEEEMEVGFELDLHQTGIVRQPATQHLGEFKFLFARPGPWGLRLQSSFSILRWKNFGHQSTPAETDLLLGLEAGKEW